MIPVNNALFDSKNADIAPKIGADYYHNVNHLNRLAWPDPFRFFRTIDPWYRAVSESFLGKRTEDSLKKEAGESPEKLITLHAALGFWAEGSGAKERAIEHYKEALESFIDTWIEFDFAKERIKSLRRASE